MFYFYVAVIASANTHFVGGDNNFIAFYFKIDPKKIALISMWQVGQFAGNADMYSD